MVLIDPNVLRELADAFDENVVRAVVIHDGKIKDAKDVIVFALRYAASHMEEQIG